jgi:hypothetical protein
VELRNYILPDVLALVLFVAVARSRATAPALPDLRRAPWWLLVAAVLVSGVLASRGVRAIQAVDAELVKAKRPRSAMLEWVYRSKTADGIIDKYTKAPSMLERAVDGLRQDTVAFIPFYPVLLFALTLLAARAWPQSSTSYGWVVAVAWLGLAAGALDLLENGGIWLELRRGLTALAPLTATAALLKWIAIALAFYSWIAAVVAVVRRGLPHG